MSRPRSAWAREHSELDTCTLGRGWEGGVASIIKSNAHSGYQNLMSQHGAKLCVSALELIFCVRCGQLWSDKKERETDRNIDRGRKKKEKREEQRDEKQGQT